MKNDTKNNTATELDFDELEIVSGGTCIDGIREVVDKTSDVLEDIIRWIID